MATIDDIILGQTPVDPDAIVRASVATDGTQGNSSSYFPAVSADGRFVVFSSIASNLVAGDDSGGKGAVDIFMRDMQTGATTLISRASDGTQGNQDSYNPSISADGRFVTFTSYASNLVAGDTNGNADIFLRDTLTGATTLISAASDGTP